MNKAGRLSTSCYVVSWVVFLLSLITALAFLFQLVPRQLYNADNLIMPALYKGLVGPFGISGWNVGNNLYLPVILLYSLFNALTGNLHMAMWLSTLAQNLLFIGVLLALHTQVYGRHMPARHLLLWIGAFFFLLFMVHATPFFQTFSFMIRLVFHFSTLPLALFSLLLLLKSLAQPVALNRYLIAMGVVSVISIASDVLYITIFIAPAAVCVLILWAASVLSFKRMAAIVICLVGVTLAGGIIFLVLTKLRVVFNVVGQVAVYNLYRNILGSIHVFVDWWWNFTVSYPYLTASWIVFMGLLSNRLFSFFQSIRKNPQSASLQRVFLHLFIFAAVAVNLGIVIGTGKLQVPNHVRYIPFTLLIPLCFGWPFLLAESKRITAYISQRLPILTLFVTTLIIAWLAPYMRIYLPTLTALPDYYPASIQALDVKAEEYGLRNGLANFWVARPVSMLSRRGLNVVQVTSDLSIYHLGNNLNEYDIDVDFLVTNLQVPESRRINMDIVFKRFGSPAATFDCGIYRVFVYNRPEDIRFREQFRRRR